MRPPSDEPAHGPRLCWAYAPAFLSIELDAVAGRPVVITGGASSYTGHMGTVTHASRHWGRGLRSGYSLGRIAVASCFSSARDGAAPAGLTAIRT
jgi:hypothetical protein